MRAAGSKLIEVQLAIHQQLYSVADQIAQVQAANPSALHSQPEVIDRDKEVEELSRALRRQQQLVHDAHRQLLELSTKRKPLGVASAHAEVGALRAALGEQEVGRMVAEARADELQAQASSQSPPSHKPAGRQQPVAQSFLSDSAAAAAEVEVGDTPPPSLLALTAGRFAPQLALTAGRPPPAHPALHLLPPPAPTHGPPLRCASSRSKGCGCGSILLKAKLTPRHASQRGCCYRRRLRLAHDHLVAPAMKPTVLGHVTIT